MRQPLADATGRPENCAKSATMPRKKAVVRQFGCAGCGRIFHDSVTRSHQVATCFRCGQDSQAAYRRRGYSITGGGGRVYVIGAGAGEKTKPSVAGPWMKKRDAQKRDAQVASSSGSSGMSLWEDDDVITDLPEKFRDHGNSKRATIPGYLQRSSSDEEDLAAAEDDYQQYMLYQQSWHGYTC